MSKSQCTEGYWYHGTPYCGACVECDSPAIDIGDAQSGEVVGKCGCCGRLLGTYGSLHDYQTGKCLRPATQAEREASDAQVTAGRHEGIIDVDGRSCYVQD